MLSIGIVGLPNVGKSTLFQAITKKQVDCQNYPFCTIEPNVGVVAVLDSRVDKLAELTQSVKKIYATVEFVDIAGLVEGAHKGEGLGNQFLAHIREVDVVMYVLRAFSNDKIINTRNEINLLKDKEILDTEMALKDLATVEKRLQGLDKEIRAKKKEAIKEAVVLNKAKAFLEEGAILAEQNWPQDEWLIVQSYQLLTAKKRLYLLNGQDGEVSLEIKKVFEEKNWPYLIMDVLAESEAILFSKEERIELGLPVDSGLDKLVKECYQLLDLITFLTTGPDETRAWQVKKGSVAPKAGYVIHSDFEKYFISANVINWQALLEAGGFGPAKAQGLLRTEGKSYIVQDGDVIEINSSK